MRRQIDSLSDMLDSETVPQAIDRIAAAIERLSKLEQVLAGRPGPGNRKPAPDRPSKRQFAPEPLPVVVQQPKPNDPNEPNG